MIGTVIRIHWTNLRRDRVAQLLAFVVPMAFFTIFAMIFGGIVRMPTDGLPYTLFYLSALVPWNTFSTALSSSALSMETNAHLISKIYFPRLVVPGAVICT